MIGHHTMDKGNIGLAKVITDLTVRGFTVLLPVYEQMPFDLVIYKDGQFCRVQVKYRSRAEGAVTVGFKSQSVYTSGKTYAKPMNKDMIDMVAIYCPDTDTCYYLDPKDFGKAVKLRIDPPANNQSRGIHMAFNYLEPKPRGW